MLIISKQLGIVHLQKYKSTEKYDSISYFIMEEKITDFFQNPSFLTFTMIRELIHF